MDIDLRGGSEGSSNPLKSYNNEVTSDKQGYSSWTDLSNQTKMSNTLNAIFSAVSSNKVVYIHCAVGADRTGYVCMLLEALLGVSQGNCDVDYEMTSFAGAVGTRTRTGTGNYYYLSTSGGGWWGGSGETTVQGVDFINTYNGNSFQEKAIDYLTRAKNLTEKPGLGIDRSVITAFQNAMLE